ncbi:MAG: glycoside hydrolase family 3 N-terminal domain-containing protein [Bacteroidota bacterium]
MRLQLHTIIYIAILLTCVGFTANAQSDAINWKKSNRWVDSVYESLSEDERIAQLIMVAAFSNRDSTHIKEIECAVREQKVGGLIFFKGNPAKQAALTNDFQAQSKVPLLIGIDGEWGVGMRLDSVLVFPRQMVLGGAQNEDAAYQMGIAVGNQCRRMGIHVNFAPDVDVNNNPKNPVINDRSFGENKYWVAKLGMQYAKGMQNQHVMACAKHFPGHGDTETDSHYSLPVVKGDRKRLDSLELYPFRELIKNDVMCVMTAHLSIPALDTTLNLPSSLSKNVVTNLLKEEMGFEGIVVTDALNMKGVTDYYKPGEITAKAFAAGNDLMEFVEDVTASIDMIKQYLNDSIIPREQLERSCKKILMGKYWAGLNQYQPVNLNHLTEDLNCCNTYLSIKKVIKQAIVVVKNDDHIIPVENPELYQKAVISVGSNQLTSFQEMCMNYINADYYSVDKTDIPGSWDTLLTTLNQYNLIVLSLQNTSRFVAKKLGLTPLEIDFVNKVLAMQKKVILVCNGNPYILDQFKDARNIIVSYEDLEQYNQLAAEALFGAIPARGKLPVTVNASLPLGMGINTESLHRFEYIYPEEMNLDHFPLQWIDTIVIEAICKGATPGAQVLVAKDGKVIYQKSFGYHTYDSAIAVKNYHLYDVASLTKILATTVGVMHLFDEHKIKLEATLGDYLPELRGSNKAKLTIQDVLLHQAGLVPFIPIYKKTLVDGRPSNLIYSEMRDSDYSIQVAQNLFMHKDYEAMLWQQIIRSDVKASGDYVYSDLGFMLLRKVVEQQTNMSFEKYLQENIYNPLNLANLTFNPLEKGINSDWIVPTEDDTFFRWQRLDGYVHDQTAAMLGGISGHAGIFGSANDVAIIMQMLANNGEYGGKRILKESTVHLFTKKQTKTNRRGLGFDKPETDPKKASPVGKAVSPLAFGHTGFTGTCAWVDPKYNLVYVFLSNRVQPSAENKKLVEMNVRTRIQDVIYESIKEK